MIVVSKLSEAQLHSKTRTLVRDSILMSDKKFVFSRPIARKLFKVRTQGLVLAKSPLDTTTYLYQFEPLVVAAVGDVLSDNTWCPIITSCAVMT